MGEPVARSAVPALTTEEGAALAHLAATAIAGRLTGQPVRPGPPDYPALRVTAASFVTLESAGTLRGCIGSLDAVRPLYLDVARNAVRAMADPRLPPVTSQEWPKLDVSVSVLTRPEPVPAAGLAELAAQVRPGVDGLLVSDGARCATFLPVVWEKLAEPGEFLAALLAKGGWPAGRWPPGLRVARYTALEFHSPAPREPLR
jgi:AmmeMemoRadiSam system protein A